MGRKILLGGVGTEDGGFDKISFGEEMNALEVRDLTKKFRRGKGLKKREILAVANASFSIAEGEIFGLLGPNGAGKTTLVRCIATLLIPESGKILLFGRDVFANSLWAKGNIGLLTSGERTLYWKLSAVDNLKFFAALYGLSPKERDKRIDYLLELLGLKEVAYERVERYSSGMKQKLSLARALLHDPKVLLLDEPTLGLDPGFARFIRNFIREELKGRHKKTILLTTHYMEEADELCDRIAFINKGKIVDVKTPAEYKKEMPHKEILEIRFFGSWDKSKIEKIPMVESISSFAKDGITTLKIIAPRVEEILSEAIKAIGEGGKILSINNQEPTLEDVFLYITGTSLKEDTKENLAE
ncbi:MAG: ABC transporter ATP-binding protein [candidate division WOR-3 bacterium]